MFAAIKAILKETNLSALWKRRKEIVDSFSQQNTICGGFAGNYILAQVLLIGVPFIIIAITAISKMIVAKITSFEKAQSKSEMMLSKAVNLFILTYVNVGILLFLVNFNLGGLSDILKKNYVPLFQGEFTTFSVQWYKLVGSTLCFTMLINVGSLHISFLASALIRWFLQCLDRGCSCDKKKTRQTIQQDYEDINTDSDFEIELRYANLLFMLGVCFLYSSGMPILYPIGAAYFLLGYWIDKFLLLKASKKPVRYDGYIANKSLNWYKFIIVMHVIAGCLIYSNSSIILTRYVFGSKETITNIWEKNTGGWKVKDFFMLHEWLFVGLFVGIALIYCFWAVIVNTYYYIRSCTGVQRPIRFKLNNYVANFYSYLDFDSLLYERISAKTMLDKYESLGKEAKENKSEYEAFVQVFKKKLKAID